MEYSFHIYNKLAADGVTMSVDKLLRASFSNKKEKMDGAGTRSNEKSTTPPSFSSYENEAAPPVVVCIGSDLAIGDSLGPVTGSLLKYKTQGVNCFLYGTLAAPVTAKEIKYLRSFLKKTHPKSQILAIDAAVGERGDIGVIRITDSPLFPGAGANKQLGCLGDVSVLGIVAEKSVSNYGILNTTRLNLVYTMSEIISEGVSALLWERAKKSPLLKNA